MTKTDTDPETSIRLAIEAAEAANAVTGDIDTMRSDIEDAADRIERTRKTLVPVLIGVGIGTMVSVVGAGLLYFRTLSDLEVTRQMQVEAIAMLTEQLGALDTHLTTMETAAEEARAREAAMSERFATLDSKLAALTGGASPDDPDAAAAGGMGPQIGRSIVDTITAAHEATRTEILAATSDLQLALSRMLDAAPAQQVRSTDRATSTRPQAAPRTSAPRSPARARPAAPPPNPVSYP